MSKVYVFGIGGTGSRVLRSLTILLASGVDCGNDTIVPIIIDPDTSGGDLTRTVSLMQTYTDIRKQLAFDGANQNEFFKTEMNQVVQNFQLPLDNKVQTLKFEDYMGVSLMGSNNQSLMSMLFSDKNLKSDMNVGFKGNPNIGSVVLNQFSQSQEFLDFANNFQQGDRIFIISSIFGGTGASGFPLLLKTLRGNNTIPNFALINNAVIGAITVLPYFNLKQNPNSAIDSTTFISKTKSALAYYDKNISGNNSIDALYYVADDINNAYDNCEGGMNQTNDAHLVELISALAIVDFVNNVGNRMTPTIHKEFGIKDLPDGINDVILSDFANGTESIIKDCLIRMFLFTKYNKNCLKKQYEHQPWAIDRKLDKSFFSGNFYKNIEIFQNDFFDWLKELSSNNRKLTMFELGNDCELFKSVKDYSPKNNGWFKKKNYELIDSSLNGQKQTGTTKEQLYINLFYDALKEVVSQKF